MANGKVAPGELGNIIVRLRQLMSAHDNASFVLTHSLSSIDQNAEDLAKTLRPQLRDTANGIYDLLARLESLPSYAKLRKDTLSND